MLHRVLASFLIVTVLTGRQAGAKLEADDLLVIVNKNVPESRQIADFYISTRGVPDGRVVELDLPTGDAMSREAFEHSVRGPLRAAIADRGLTADVSCLVTTFGVPLRVDGIKLTADEQAERQMVEQLADEAVTRLRPMVDRLATTAEAVGRPVPQLPDLSGPLQLELNRLAVAEQLIQAGANDLTEGEKASLIQTLGSIRQSMAQPMQAGAGPLTEAESAQLQEAVTRLDLPEQRDISRTLGRQMAFVQYAGLINVQLRHLTQDKSDGSFDSELATLPDLAPAAALWLPNPLQGGRGKSGLDGNAIMVARLDGPTPQHVRDLIANSLLVEREGLDGNIVVDSRGLRMPGANGKPDGYAPFDEQLRRLAAALEQAATLPVVHDDKPAVFARGANDEPAVENVAMYVGWYQLRDYNRPFDLARGAVAYHVASYEMVSLHNAGEKGWARGLLMDGAAATVGPVSEPFLNAFPPPWAFLPIVLKGDATLAEAYWATVPHVSWKMVLVGDPLYRPFAAKSGLKQ